MIDIVQFHTEYEHIHPFQDGKGRTGHAIILKQCLDSNIVPVIISNDDKASYYHALHAAPVDCDYEKLLVFFSKHRINITNTLRILWFCQMKKYLQYQML